jgi:dolichol-phosphate mannosyltransferase
MRWLTAIPVYNEARHVQRVLTEVRRYVSDLLVVNDGSTDGTSELLDREPHLFRVNHERNQGYGAALISAFEFAVRNDYDFLVTMDCDGQHTPTRIPVLLEAFDSQTDIVSGSRYLRDFRQDTPAPSDRQNINRTITSEINDRFGLEITDAFCGFKAYSRRALSGLRITEKGWGMPLQLWVQAAQLGLRVKEIAVPRIYLDPNRAFGGVLDQPEERLRYYRSVLDSADGKPLTPLELLSVPTPCWEPSR